MTDENQRERRIADLAHREPGEDDENPYEDVNIDSLPGWWQRAINEFAEYGLRPYRPPRLQNGELKHEVVEELEEQFGVDIVFIGKNTQYGDKWKVRVDGEMVDTVGKRRSPNGYTIFGVDSDTVRKLVERFVETRE